MALIFFDCETFCETPINYGVYRYAENVEVTVIAYAVDDGAVEVIDMTDDFFADRYKYFLEHINDPKNTVIIHNSQFDRVVMREALGVDIPVERIHDTLTQARTVGLPGGLGVLSDIFKLPIDKAKDKKGKELINLFCKPRPKTSKIRRATRETHKKEWQEFLDYARLDIEAMRVLYNKLPTWNYRDRELALWQLVSKINDKGICIDTSLARAAIKAVEQTKKALNSSTSYATLGFVRSATQRDELLRYILNVYGVELPDMQASTLERRLVDPELPEGVRELIAMRLQVCTTSTAKYQKLLDCVSSDGRLRGTLEFCGAGRTGRDAGRNFQPQNLPSKGLLPPAAIELGIKALKEDCAELFFDNIMKLASSCIRGCITAPADKKLVISDLSNIEGRIVAWYAGEQWKIDAFRDYDLGIGEDLYRLAYAKAFGILVSMVDGGKSKGPMRQIGKVLELAMGFEGGVGSFLTFAAVYDINLQEMADAAWPSIPLDVREEAQEAWCFAIRKRKTFDLTEHVYMTCDSLKRLWRRAHPETTSYWAELKNCVEVAIDNPGKIIPCRKVKMHRINSWLKIILPSGRSLCYAAPKFEYGQFTYMGVNPYSRQWTRIKSYGGKVLENCAQGGARDVMMHNLPAIEEAGYSNVLRVHDEVVCETPDTSDYTAEKLSALLAANPPWAMDMPLAASGFESYRYRKDD